MQVSFLAVVVVVVVVVAIVIIIAIVGVVGIVNVVGVVIVGIIDVVVAFETISRGGIEIGRGMNRTCLLYTSPSPRD